MSIVKRVMGKTPTSGKAPRRSCLPLHLELLEKRELLASSLHLAFGATPVLHPGDTQVTSKSLFTTSSGYGWQSGAVSDSAQADLTTKAAFTASLPNGAYQVTVTLGDPKAAHDQMQVSLQGSSTPAVSTSAGQSTTVTRTVNVTSGQLNLLLTDLGGTSPTAAIQRLDAVPLPTAQFTGPASVNEGGTATVTFTNVSGGSGGYTYSYDFNNDGVFEVSGSSSASAVVPAAYLADGPFTRTIHGRVTDSAGHYTDYTRNIQVVNVPPTARISSPSAGIAGQALSFTASASDPSSADTQAGFVYRWTFGDGSSATGQSVSHAYTAPGNYTVTLTATDKDGGKGSTTRSVTVASLNPIAQFTGPASVNEGGTATVVFSKVSGGSGPYTYSYDFNNDGVFEVTASPSASAVMPASYLADGPRTLTVHGRVTDSTGHYTDYTTTIQVVNVAPTATFTMPPTALPGSTVDFNGSATDPSKADVAAGFTWSWNFGDGGTATGQSATHIYSAAGTYTVTLSVKDKDGGVGISTSTITVSQSTPYILTPNDKIPNFGAHPTIFAAHSGNWSDPTTWSLGRLPGAGDVVAIGAGVTVTYDMVSDAPIDTVAIQAGGHLVFRTDVNTRLTVTNLLVLEGGELQVGTQANPVASTVKAEIVIADTPIDTTTDPSQYGHGLIALGTVNIHGAVKSQTFVDLAAEAHAGDTTLHLSKPVTDWAVGDKLILPDTRQLLNQPLAQYGYSSQLETVTIASISADGTTITLTAPLQYDHLGARDAQGVLDYLPQVADLTRNVVIHSQSATGTRGYALFTYHANVDIEYATIGGFGRSTINLPDNTTYDSNGNVTHVGTNEAGRYPVTFRDLVGPTSPQADGAQFTFRGNTVRCPLDPMPFRWGIAIDGSSYGLIQDNVVDNWAGAGIVTVQGNESYNRIDHNFVADITGTGQRADYREYITGVVGATSDYAFEGSAFWFRNGNNYVTNNVATNATQYGYTIYAWHAKTGQIPAYQGADPSLLGQSVTFVPQATALLEFSGNEVYGATTRGLTIWNIGANGSTTPLPNMPQSVVKDFVVWHQSGFGYFGYPSQNILFDHFVARGDSSLLRNVNTPSTGLWFGDYLSQNVVVDHADIQGEQYGIIAPYKVGETLRTGQTPMPFTVQNSYLANYYNVFVRTLWAVTGGGVDLSPRQTILSNDTFGRVAMTDRNGDPQQNIVMKYQTSGPNVNLTQLDQVLVYNYNGVSGDNFQVYYTQQAPSFVLPQSTPASTSTTPLIGSPVSGLTNQENWDQYGIALAGALAPPGAKTRDGITGLVNPI
jgi:PKD repeat protein